MITLANYISPGCPAAPAAVESPTPPNAAADDSDAPTVACSATRGSGPRWQTANQRRSQALVLSCGGPVWPLPMQARLCSERLSPAIDYDSWSVSSIDQNRPKPFSDRVPLMRLVYCTQVAASSASGSFASRS
jgi:hypothetical protein